MKNYSLSCKDMGVSECNYSAVAETKDEVIDMATKHFKTAHPEKAKKAMEETTKDEMEQKMMDKITEIDD